jgi:regulator of ribonuclease activity A
MNKPTARSICDLCDDFPDEVQAAEPILRNFGGADAFRGEVVTVQCYEDNAVLAEVLNEAGAGRVLVVDGGGSLTRALVGGKMGARAVANGWAGIVVHGAVRDVEELQPLPIGVLAVGICPMRPNKSGAGRRDAPLRFAGASIRPGQWVYVDRNGLIVSDRELH